MIDTQISGILRFNTHRPRGICQMKILRAHGGCLGIGSRRRARQAAISRGEAQTAFDPADSRMGEPSRGHARLPRLNTIGLRRQPGELKHLSTPRKGNQPRLARVAASESARAQTRARASAGRCRAGVAGRSVPSLSGGAGQKTLGQGNGMGRPAAAGESPVREGSRARGAIPSSAGHVKPGPKQGGPPSKAEHSPMTDSEPVP